MSNPKPRRIVLIDPRFQFRLAGLFLLVLTLVLGVFALGLYIFLESEVQTVLASAHASARSLERMLLPIVGVLTLACLLVSAVLVTWFVVLLSHRIAGPLYRFRTALEDLAARRLSPHTRIRAEDQLGELSASLGAVVATWSGDIEGLRAQARDLRLAMDAQDAPAMRAALDALNAHLERWGPVTGA